MNEPVHGPARRAARFRIGWVGPVGLLLVVAGAVVLLQDRPDPADMVVDWVRISEAATINQPGGATDSALERLKRSLSKPDYYLAVRSDDGEQTTDVRHNTPIGNGLTFALPTPTPLRHLREIRVMHDGLFSDPIVDRVDVTGPVHRGQVFLFELHAMPTDEPAANWRPITGWALVAVGGLLALTTLARFVYQQVV